MSYDIYVFHPDVKEKSSQGVDLDSFEPPPLSESAVQVFMEQLVLSGYTLEHQSEYEKTFVKVVGQCPVQVRVSQTVISFTVPYWNGSKDAIFDALQDSCELCNTQHMVTFNPQESQWGP